MPYSLKRSAGLTVAAAALCLTIGSVRPAVAAEAGAFAASGAAVVAYDREDRRSDRRRDDHAWYGRDGDRRADRRDERRAWQDRRADERRADRRERHDRYPDRRDER